MTAPSEAPLPTSMAGAERTPPWRYALGMFGTSIPITMIKSSIVLFYVDILGLDVRAYAVVMIIYAVIDAIDNPVLGYLSDRTRTRFGRRRPWLLVGAPLLAASMIALFSPPSGLDGLALVLWFAIFAILCELFDSLLNANYGALLPELFPTERRRGLANALRQAYQLVAMIISLALTPVLTTSLLGTEETTGGFTLTALLYGLLAVAVITVMALGIKENPHHAREQRPRLLPGVLEILRSPLFWAVGLTSACYGIALAIVLSGVQLYVRYTLELPVAYAFVLQGIVILVAAGGLPLWLRLVTRIGALRTWRIAFLVLGGLLRAAVLRRLTADRARGGRGAGTGMVRHDGDERPGHRQGAGSRCRASRGPPGRAVPLRLRSLREAQRCGHRRGPGFARTAFRVLLRGRSRDAARAGVQGVPVRVPAAAVRRRCDRLPLHPRPGACLGACPGACPAPRGPLRGHPVTRRLVITADDLGRDAAGTDVIHSLHADGAITRSTLIPVSAESERAADRFRRSGLPVQLHLTLSSDAEPAPWRPLTSGRTLGDERGGLPVDARRVERLLDPVHARAELDAQLAWMHEAGLRPRSADSHAGVLYGLRGGEALLPMVLEWCAEHGLGFRFPRDPQLYLGADLRTETRIRHRRAVELADSLGVRLPAAILTTGRTVSTSGTSGGYEALRSELIHGLHRLPAGASELFLHPSAAGPGVPLLRTWEARLLRDPHWLDALRTERIELVEEW